MHRNSVIKADFKVLVLVILCRVLLDIIYYYAISPAHFQFSVAGISMFKFIESYLLLVLVFVFLAKDNKKVSSLILQVFFLFMFIPSLSYYSFANVSRSWVYSVTFFWIFVNVLNSIRVEFLIKPVKQRNIFYWAAIFCIPFVTLLLLFLYYGFSFNFDFSKVYQIRAEHEQIPVPLCFDYFVIWTGKIVMPFIMLLALYGEPHKKKLLTLFLAISAQIAIFAITGHKIYLFNMLSIFALAWLVKRKNFFATISFIVFCLFGVGILMCFFTTDVWYNSLIARRTFLGPAQLSFYYYDFFKSNPIYLSGSIFRYFISYPYNLAPPNLIGSVYFNDSDMHANNGIISDGFMNFGYLGVFIWSIALFLLLKLADNLTKFKNKRVVYPIMILSFVTLINGYLLTTILTHGLFLAFLLVYFSENEYDALKTRVANSAELKEGA